MNVMYAVMHVYDVDGGWGDRVSQSDIVAIFKNRVTAEEYAERYTNEVAYDNCSYFPLTAGNLVVKEIPYFTGRDCESVPKPGELISIPFPLSSVHAELLDEVHSLVDLWGIERPHRWDF